MGTPIFAPFFAMILLTLIVWIYMYARRLAFIRRSDLAPDQLNPLELARVSPPSVSNPSDNLRNLFELPVIFYALILYLDAADEVDSIHLAAAWVFVVFRVLHSAVHCTVNVVLVRFLLYCVSALALWLMAARAALAALGS